MSTHNKQATRVQVEVDGYTWRIHGRRHGLRWRAHLVELVGPLPLAVMAPGLRDKIRTALAKALELDESEVARISADLILA